MHNTIQGIRNVTTKGQHADASFTSGMFYNALTPAQVQLAEMRDRMHVLATGHVARMRSINDARKIRGLEFRRNARTDSIMAESVAKVGTRTLDMPGVRHIPVRLGLHVPSSIYNYEVDRTRTVTRPVLTARDPEPTPASEYKRQRKASGLGMWVWVHYKTMSRMECVNLGYAAPKAKKPTKREREATAKREREAEVYALRQYEAARAACLTLANKYGAERMAEHREAMRQASVRVAYVLNTYWEERTDKGILGLRKSASLRKLNTIDPEVHAKVPEVVDTARRIAFALTRKTLSRMTDGGNARRTKVETDGTKDVHFKHEAPIVKRASDGRILRQPRRTPMEGRLPKDWRYTYRELSEAIESGILYFSTVLGKPVTDREVIGMACRDADHTVFSKMQRVKRKDLADTEIDGHAADDGVMAQLDGNKHGTTPEHERAEWKPAQSQVERVFAAVREYWIQSGSRKWQGALASSNKLLTDILACESLPDTHATEVKLSRLVEQIRKGWELLGYDERVPSLPIQAKGRPPTLTI